MRYIHMRGVFGKKDVGNGFCRGGANTDFFHSVANGRRRKCSIQSLETKEGEISEPSGLRKHKEENYKQLFGREERGGLGLEGNF
jgi:hypothetical protein